MKFQAALVTEFGYEAAERRSKLAAKLGPEMHCFSSCVWVMHLRLYIIVTIAGGREREGKIPDRCFLLQPWIKMFLATMWLEASSLFSTGITGC